jgi:hypothetical protein
MEEQPDHRPPSVAVVERVAAREGVDPVEVTPPLSDVVDPEALDRLSGADSGALVVFSYCGYVVTIDEGSVSVESGPPHDAVPDRLASVDVVTD